MLAKNPKMLTKNNQKGSQQSINHIHWHTKINAVKYVNGHHIVFVTQIWKQTKILYKTYLHYSLLPPQGFGPEAKTRGGIIETPA